MSRLIWSALIGVGFTVYAFTQLTWWVGVLGLVLLAWGVVDAIRHREDPEPKVQTTREMLSGLLVVAVVAFVVRYSDPDGSVAGAVGLALAACAGYGIAVIVSKENAKERASVEPRRRERETASSLPPSAATSQSRSGAADRWDRRE